MKPDLKDLDAEIEFVRDRAINDKRYWVNYSKIEELGWTPQTSFEEGLKKTVKWYAENPGHWGDISSVLVAHPQIGNKQEDNIE